MLNPLASACRAARSRNAQEAQTVRRHRLAGGRPFLLGRQLASHALQATHGALWHDQGAAGLAGDQQRAQRWAQSARGVPRPDDDERLPLVATRVDAIRTVRLRRTGRRSHRAGGLHADYAADCPNRPVAVEAIGGAYGSGGWFHRDDFPKMASVEAAAEMWSRGPHASDVQVAERRRLHVPDLRVVGGVGFLRRRRGRTVRGRGDAHRARRRATAEYLWGQLSTGRMHGYWLLHGRACSCGARPVTASSPGDPRWPSPRREAARSPPPWC